MAMNVMRIGGSGSARGLMFLLVASMLLGLSLANKTASGCAPKKITVGGSTHWRFGFNYSQWALKKAPFYVNDVLVFKYDAPNATTFPHSVYSFRNKQSYLTCNLTKAKQLGSPTEGASSGGFKYVLKKKKTYYFACGEHGGVHCKVGGMKFLVKALRRKWF